MQRFGPSIILPRLHLCRVSLVLGRSSRNSTNLRGLHWRRLFESVRSASTHTKRDVDVDVGGNGFVTLSVVRSKLAQESQSPTNVIIRLPQGPLFQEDPGTGDISPSQNGTKKKTSSTRRAKGDDSGLSARALSDLTNSTIVTINYRLGPVPFDINQIPLHSRIHIQNGTETPPDSLIYRYPTPVHDTLAGFDWVQRHLSPARLGIMGTGIGGSLALMLALTEPRSIHAIAALDPVCDWTSLDEYCTSPNAPKRKRHAPRDLVPLLKARESLFATHERYFDPFASPILFLRSPGKDTPKLYPRYLTGPEHPVPLLVSKEPEELELWDAYVLENTGLEYMQGLESELKAKEGEDSDNAAPARRRKALSRWPPYGLDYGVEGPPGRYSRVAIEKVEVGLPWVNVFHQTSQQPAESANPTLPPTSESDEGGGEADQEPKSPMRRRKTQNETVLSHQATEMVDVMRRACFWGREKGFGENRVTLSSVVVPDTGSDTGPGEFGSGVPPAKEKIDLLVGRWLAETFKAEADAEGGKSGDGNI